MAMGEYVSVSTQKDSQRMALIEEKERLDEDYQSEYDFVKQKYLDQGIDPALATQATNELMAKDALGTVVLERHGFNPHEIHQPLCGGDRFYDLVSAWFDPANGGGDDYSGGHPDLGHRGRRFDRPMHHRVRGSGVGGR